MTDEPIPQPLIILGEHFRLMAGELSMRMDATSFESGTVYNIFDLVDDHMTLLGNHVSAFCEEVSNGLGQLTHEPDEYFHGVANRLNAELFCIVDAYDDVRSLTPSHEDFEGWSLLVEIHEETLFQIQRWLEEVVEFLDDPLAGVKKRGIPSDGSGAVNLRLEMRAPHQVNQLTRWLNRRGHDLMSALQGSWKEDRRRAHRTGMIAGTILGLWLGKG